MIDFHTHILPGIDDGSDSLDTSVQMLQTLYTQNVDTVVLTPHYYSHRQPLDQFLSKRNAAFEQIRNLDTTNIPDMILGTEVFFSDYLFNNSDLSPLCIQGTRTMLLELPYNKTVNEKYVEKIDRLIAEYNVTVVLAHIERYPTLIKSKALLENFMDIGCILQTNLSSFTEFGKGRLIRLVKEGYIGAFGTDAHNLTSRPPQYSEGYTRLQKSISNETLQNIQDTMRRILSKK